MKLSLPFAALILFAAAIRSSAQDSSSAALQPPRSTKDAAAAVPLPEQSGGTTLEKPIQLMPKAPANMPNRRSEGTSVRQKTGAANAGPANTFRAEETLKLRIRMRQLCTRVLNEPETQREWDVAHRAKTDPERRALLKVYYTHLYDSILKMDPSLAELVNGQKTNAIERLRYTRLEADVEQQSPTGLDSAEPGIPPEQVEGGVSPVENPLDSGR